ncbi:hypothetical protein B9H00_12585 [Kushneria marisflavi]|uniref:Uncharacterized protein n=1 Tax=Kushneria marisflavi TaxID=157779 RepID=A0A240UQN1_9GAMM|nr:hypothetical protein B9H00_12585 [Kushneria marisflavi]
MAATIELLKHKSDTTDTTIIAGLFGSGDNDRHIRQGRQGICRHSPARKADVMNLMGAAA